VFTARRVYPHTVLGRKVGVTLTCTVVVAFAFLVTVSPGNISSVALGLPEFPPVVVVSVPSVSIVPSPVVPIVSVSAVIPTIVSSICNRAGEPTANGVHEQLTSRPTIPVPIPVCGTPTRASRPAPTITSGWRAVTVSLATIAVSVVAAPSAAAVPRGHFSIESCVMCLARLCRSRRVRDGYTRDGCCEESWRYY
jgi:hypothetical protein